MPGKAKPRRTGRPRTELTRQQWATVESMARAMCTSQEIADYLGVSRQTLRAPHLRERYEAILAAQRAATRYRLRQRQIEIAEKSGTNVIPLIWLGKNYLGQRDRQDVAVEAPVLQTMADAGGRLLELLARAEAAAKAREQQ